MHVVQAREGTWVETKNYSAYQKAGKEDWLDQ